MPIINLYTNAVETKQLTEKVTRVLYEYLTPHLPKSITQQLDLNVETLAQHRCQPCTIQNISITPSLLQKEIHQEDTSALLVIDGSASKEVPDIFKKYQVAKGYQYIVQHSSNQAFFEDQHLMKTLEYQFELGDKGVKPCFIGQLDLISIMSEIREEQNHGKLKMTKVLNAYAVFSKKTSCPIFLNMQAEYQNSVLTVVEARRRYEMANQFFDWLKKWGCEDIIRNIVLINPPIFLSHKFSGSPGAINTYNQLSS